ncbi:MAG TPA: beta-L-arabinofuranosidase domain-containing protein [Vicinamibacterales bacterium]|nr:beta-L-arabinofuranosidase domain-containing protein [Vicinamibacterales bacterium]
MKHHSIRRPAWAALCILSSCAALAGLMGARPDASQPAKPREQSSAARGPVAPVAPAAARPLPLTAVRLTGGPLKAAQDATARYLLALEPDRMLAYYRQRAGLQPRAEPYGGWDGDGRNLTGHIAGHYLSAVSLMWAATGDRRFKERADYIVKEVQEVQAKHGDGFAGALAGVKEAFAEVAKGNIRSASFDLNGLWSPWYTLHKTFAGLRDAYRHTGNRAALDVETAFAGWAERMLAPLDDGQMQRMLNTEFGGMNEVLADLYADTGDSRWLALSRRFEHRAVLDPLKRHEDPLAGLHGNTQVPKVLGSLARFVYTGDLGDGVAAAYFWDRVARHHSFATGGHGKDEYFREPERLGNIVDGRTAESCNVYNMLKLTRALFALRPDVEYAEFHERALFNHVLGSIDPSDGAMCYMVPVGRGVRREYQDMMRSFTCCVGTGMESHALHGDGIYYESADRLWVNLYVPSTAEWQGARTRVQMDTDFPEGEAATLTLTLASPRSFTIALRRPSWAGEGFRVAVNGGSIRPIPGPGSYVEVTREWKTGDTVAVSLPKSLRLEPTPDNERVAAIMWGPLVLAGDLGSAPERARGAPPAPRPDVPALVARNRPVGEWVKPVPGRPGAFRTEGAGRERDVELVPFYRLHRRIYGAYWDLFTPAEYSAKVAEDAAEHERLRRLEQATVAFVQPGDAASESRFDQKGEGAAVLRVEGRPGRRSTNWFSYDVPIDAAQPMALVVTYHSDQRRRRRFEVLVEGLRVGEQTLEESSVARFFDVEYPLPPDLVRGKEKATVRFQGLEGSEVPGVFGVRVTRASR